MSTTLNFPKEITNSLHKLIKEVYFEYDDEVTEWCAFFKWVDWYYGQWETKNEALSELIASFLDKVKTSKKK